MRFLFETMSRWILQDEACPMPPQSVYMVAKSQQHLLCNHLLINYLPLFLEIRIVQLPTLCRHLAA